MSQCGVHATVDAVFVCERCGTFGCEACRGYEGEDACRACAERAAAARLEPVSLGEAFGAAFALPRRYWKHGCVYLTVSCATSWIWMVVSPRLLGEAPDVSQALAGWTGGTTHALAQLKEVLQPLLPHVAAGAAVDLLGWVLWLWATGAMTLSVVRGHFARPPSLAGTYAASSKRLFPVVAANALVNLCAFFGLIACVLPGVGLLIAGCFVDPFVLVGGRGPFQAFAASARLVRRALPATLVLLLATLVSSWLLNRGVSMLGGPTLQSALRTLVERLVDLPLICAIAYLYVRLEGVSSRSMGLAIAQRSG